MMSYIDELQTIWDEALVNATMSYIDELQTIWDEALVNATNNFKTNEAIKNTSQQESDDVKYELKKYSKHQIENWNNSKKILIYQNDKQLREFVNKSISGDITDKKIYFGIIPESLANLIKINTGIDVSGFNVSLSSNEIRKIGKDHGNNDIEQLRGQRAVTEDDYANIPIVIQSPDNVLLSNKLYNGKPVIIFSKVINEKMTVAAVVSDKHLDLFVQTAYISNKKGNLSTLTAEQAAVNTPEAGRGTVSNNSINQNDSSVNTHSMQNSEKNSLRVVNRPLIGDVKPYIKEVKNLTKENENLENDIIRLKSMLKLQKTVTGGKIANPVHVKRAAIDILRNINSRYTSKELVPRLQRLYDWLSSGNSNVCYEEFADRAYDIAKDIANNIRMETVENDTYSGFIYYVKKCVSV